MGSIFRKGISTHVKSILAFSLVQGQAVFDGYENKEKRFFRPLSHE